MLSEEQLENIERQLARSGEYGISNVEVMPGVTTIRQMIADLRQMRAALEKLGDCIANAAQAARSHPPSILKDGLLPVHVSVFDGWLKIARLEEEQDAETR